MGFVNKSIQTGADMNEHIGIGLNDIKARSIGVHIIRGHPKDDPVVAAAASNTIATADTIIAGFAGTATVTSQDDDSAREFAQDVNNIANKTGVSAAARTNVLLKTLSAATTSLEIGKQGTVGASGANGLSAVVVNATITTMILQTLEMLSIMCLGKQV